MTMVTVASDPFPYTNQSGWPSPWSQTLGIGVLSIVSNQGQLTSPASTNYMIYTGTLTPFNVDVFARINPSSGGANIGVIARYVDANDLARLTISNGLLRADIISGGTQHSLTAGSVTITGGTSYRVHFNCQDNVYSANVWVDGNSEPAGWMYQQTDASKFLTVGGTCGLYGFPNSGNILKYDAFSATFVTQNYYVATTGSDSNPGTQGSPWLTMAHAATVQQLGDTVHVVAGTYDGAFTIAHSGTALYPVTYISDTRWGAALTNTAAVFQTVLINADYVTFDSFDVRNDNNQFGIDCNNFGHITIKHNLIHDCATLGSLGAGGGIGVSGACTGNILIDSNVIHHNGHTSGSGVIHGIYAQSPTGGVISNNIFYDFPGGFGVQVWGNGVANWDVVNNTFFSCTSFGGVVVGGFAGVTANVRVLNNIVRDSIVGVRTLSAGCTFSNITIQYNDVWNCTIPYLLDASTSQSLNITVDPQMVNFRLDGSGDYHLLAMSPCIDAGTATGASSTDYDGVARPLGAGYDLGAYEYNPFTSLSLITVNGIVLDSQPTVLAFPLPTISSLFEVGALILLIFNNPSANTQTMLANGSMVSLRFPFNGQAVTAQVRIASSTSSFLSSSISYAMRAFASTIIVATTTSSESVFQVICTVLSPTSTWTPRILTQFA
jgi:hypothetical protein